MGRDISKGRYLLRWHTHRLVTKTQNYSPYLLIGVFSFLFFSISVDLSVKQTRETVSFFLWLSQPNPSLEQAQHFKKNCTKLHCHFSRKITVHTRCVYQYAFLLRINTAKYIKSCKSEYLKEKVHCHSLSF